MLTSFPVVGRFWSFCRLIYMPMAYMYGRKFVGPITPTILSIRTEIHDIPYNDIDWNKARDICAKVSFIKFWLDQCNRHSSRNWFLYPMLGCIYSNFTTSKLFFLNLFILCYFYFESRRIFSTHGLWCKILYGLAWMKLWNQCWVVGQLTN